MIGGVVLTGVAVLTGLGLEAGIEVVDGPALVVLLE